MNNRFSHFQSSAFYLSTILIWLSVCLFSSSLLTAQEAYLLGDDNNNQFTEVKNIQNDLYAVGNVRDNTGNTFGTFSKIDLTTGAVIWTTQLDIRSSLHDFIVVNNMFIAVGRTEPIENPNGGWLDNQSLVTKISMTGAVLQTRVYDVDQDGGREGFSKIVRNNTPLDPAYPFYIAGHIDADGGIPNAIDDLVVTSIDFNLNPFITRRYFNAAGNNTDDEFDRVFIALNDGTGQMVLMGNEVTNGTTRAVAFYINNDGSVAIGSERHFYPSLEVIHDAILLPNRQFIIVGRNAQNTNFIMKTDGAFNPFWAAQIPEHQEFLKVIQHEDAYYTVMLERNSTNQNRYIVNRIKESGGIPSLDWSKTLHDNDNSFSHPFIHSTGNQIVYGNSRIPDATGEIISGYGLQDIMMAVTDQTLETCITQLVPTELIALSVEPRDYQIASITVDVPNNNVQEWHFIEYDSRPVCEESCCDISPNVFHNWVQQGFTWTNNCLDFTAFPNHDFEEECDEVTWIWNDGTPNTITVGNNPVNHVFPSTGVYNVCIIVTRYDENGEICMQAEWCTTIEIECPNDCCDISPNIFHDWVQQGFTWTNNCLDFTAFPNHDFEEECDEVTWIWNDGTPNTITVGNNPVNHVFPSTGVYNVCIIVTRYDENGEICMQAEWCTTIEIECPNDCCDISPNIFHDWVQQGFTWTNNCLDLTVVPNHDFEEECDRIRWVWGDGSVPSNSVGNNPVTHTYLNSGWYVICMEVTRFDANGEVCMTARTYREVYVEDCECLCDESFYDDVNAGFTVTTGACRNRTISANNVGENECDQIVWSVRGPGQPGIGFMGTSFSYNFPTNGIYEICMYVTRTNPVTGEVCEFVYCRRIKVRCVFQVDPWVISHTANLINNFGFGMLINPFTTDGANRMTDWEIAMGTPETLAGSGCDDDNYAELSGNKTVVDGLQQSINMEANTYYELSHCYQFLTAQFGEPKAGTELVFRISKTAQTTPDCVGDCDEIGRFVLPSNATDDWASADQTPYYSGDMSGSVYLTIHLENGLPDDGTDASKSFINIDNILLEKMTNDCDDYDITLTDEGFVEIGYPYVRAENDIFSDMVIGGDAVATYRAGNSINLTGGFEIQLGVDFTAEIANCTQQSFTDDAEFRQEKEEESTTDENIEQATKLYSYPNPFTQNTLIEYQVSTTETVQINVFDMTGQLIKNLLPSQTKEAGLYQVTFEANDLSEGIYYIRMNVNDKVLTQKVVLLK